MSVTYTENLGLGMQEDKTDYLDWNVITENWKKLDAAVSGSGGIGTIGTASVTANGGMQYTIGIAVKGEME